MDSTATSELLLSVRGVGLDYPMQLYRNRGLRDVFVENVLTPWKLLSDPVDMLPVLRDVSFELKTGDRLGLLGINGAGKTTLCRVMCGMIRPPVGQVRANGRVEAIFDVATGIMPELTGRENAHLIAHLFYSSSEVPTGLIEEALEFSELGVFLDAPFKTYSRGMQARLALSLVSATPSDVLILDEVFDGADMFFRTKVAARMKKKIEASGAVVFVSHAIEQISELCNRVILLDRGGLIFDGGVEEGITLYTNHQNSTFGR
jgi:ABC-2 type transport system ATP-binding protein